VAFETILNCAWLLLGFTALAFMLGRSRKGRSPVLCCVGVGLIIAALFPIISASDDVIRIQHLERVHGSSNRNAQNQSSNTNGHKRTNDTLIRLYEAMESPLAVTPVRISFVLFFAFLTVPLCAAYARQCTIAQSGRSPPARVA
jgi:hypothetical protein